MLGVGWMDERVMDGRVMDGRVMDGRVMDGRVMDGRDGSKQWTYTRTLA